MKRDKEFLKCLGNGKTIVEIEQEEINTRLKMEKIKKSVRIILIDLIQAIQEKEKHKQLCPNTTQRLEKHFELLTNNSI